MENTDYVKAEQIGRDTVLAETRFFDLKQTLDNGQAFRWCEAGENTYHGIAHGRRLELVFSGGNLTLKDCALDEFEAVWKEYFDFTRGYEKIHSRFSVCGTLSKALNFAPGLRLLKQDIWEVLISFILSQNANIPRIKKMVGALCENFGQKLPCGAYAFPAPDVLAPLEVSDFAPIRSGYRAAYILDAARCVTSGKFDIRAMEKLPSDEIFRALLQIHGVGAKVADCVLLYGFGRAERYPRDVWIKRVMAAHYPNGLPSQTEELSGIAQQFLFYFFRSCAYKHLDI
jgi:N-glycosylase/DNA lyase